MTSMKFAAMPSLPSPGRRPRSCGRRRPPRLSLLYSSRVAGRIRRRESFHVSTDCISRRMLRPLMILAAAVLCASCRTESLPAPSQAEPLVSLAEINARDDCLRREVARLLEPEGSSPTALQNVAVSAASYCSQAIKARLLRASPTVREGQELARDDQVKTERRAFAFGLELRESRAR
jgi:hypothetical protein